MLEAGFLEQAIGAPGRLIAGEPFGEGRIVRFAVDEGPEQGDWFVDTSRQTVARETGFVIRDRDGKPVARIWKHPFDPRLPALRTALDPERLLRIALAGGSTPGPIDARVLSYRPGRRAVVRLTQHGRHMFVKVVRPGEAEDLARIHQACRDAGVPAPKVVHWAPSGVLVVRDAPGTRGPVAAASSSASDLLDAVDDLRERLAGVRTRRIARASVGSRIEWHIDRLAALLPEREREVRALAAAVQPNIRREGAPRVIHGDLHIGQLFFAEGAVASVIDVDTTGLGDPCDDTAAFIGHATASAVRNEVAGRASDARLLHTLAETAADRWMLEPHTTALTSLHLVGHAIRAGDRSGDAANLLLDEALDLQGIRRSR
ncbi:Predicted kinase, aminoglycoside phosphotransferase (APT) family [Agrococcus baldri]|uniref:Predicted kinase, aminoglycoside phosphotransferase (APT) family n=1 Tax=Agrococcus baldri TaxID=153730 RepID=A0AA94HN16_9MICO|nr:phosphotransferase [Agrococcus baldri]SFS11884.1 Predicted kinase, aminoglycoside phosphotransferase (APT) family [Agrococcus baldri]